MIISDTIRLYDDEDFSEDYPTSKVLEAVAYTFGINSDRLRAIAEAERDGRLVVLPSKIGSKVYAIRTYACDDCEHYAQDAEECDFKCPERIEEIPFELWMAEDKHRIPARIFFTKAEAEAALSAGKGE